MNVPVYKLYGEKEQWLAPDMVHCESIPARASLHNWRISPHRHHGLFQLVLLTGGSATARIDEAEVALAPGQLLALPEMIVHGFHFAPGTTGFVATLGYPLLERLLGRLGDAALPVSAPQLIDAAQEVGGERLAQLFALLHQEYRDSGAQRELMLESLLSAIFVLLSRGCRLAQGSAARTTVHFRRYCQLIDAAFAHQHQVGWYAAQLGITPSHLNALCRQAVGRSALALVQERLLMECRRALVHTNDTAAGVALRFGFADPAYFTRFFKRHTGISPSAFRQQARAALERPGAGLG